MTSRPHKTGWGDIGLIGTASSIRSTAKNAGFSKEGIQQDDYEIEKWTKQLEKYQKIGGVRFYPRVRWGVDFYVDGRHVRKEQFGVALLNLFEKYVSGIIDWAVKDTLQNAEDKFIYWARDMDLMFSPSKKAKPANQHLRNIPINWKVRGPEGELNFQTSPSILTVTLNPETGEKLATLKAGEMYLHVEASFDKTNFPYFDAVEEGAGIFGPKHQPAPHMVIIKKPNLPKMKKNYQGTERQIREKDYFTWGRGAEKKAISKWFKKSPAVRKKLESLLHPRAGPIAPFQARFVSPKRALDPNKVFRLPESASRRISPEKNIWLGFSGRKFRDRFARDITTKFVSFFKESLMGGTAGTRHYPWSLYKRTIRR